MATSRIISADSHVSVQHDDVKAHLAAAAARRVRRRADAGVPRDARWQRGQGQPGWQRDPSRVVEPAWLRRAARAAPRHGHRRRRHRGPLLRGRARTATSTCSRPARPRRRARSTTRCTTSRRRTRRGSIVTYQVPIHDIDLAVARDRTRRGDGRQVAAAAGVPRRAGPARLLPRALRPDVGGDLEQRAPGVLPHRARTPRSTSSPTATRPRASRGRCRACRCRRAKRSACGCSPASSPAIPS